MTQPAPAVRVSETMGPKEIGAHMRGLREQFNLSQQNVSEQLHIRVRYVAAIEEGNYEAMPGKIYARGYVQTYAEFLGLDADQIVKQCFPPPAPVVVEPGKPKPAETTPAPRATPSVRQERHWKPLIGIAMFVLLAIAGYSLVSGESSDTDEDIQVAQVPESLLASVRGAIMPTARNYDCLTGDSALGCYFAQDMVKTIAELHYQATEAYTDEIAYTLAHPAPPESETEAKPDQSSETHND